LSAASGPLASPRAPFSTPLVLSLPAVLLLGLCFVLPIANLLLLSLSGDPKGARFSPHYYVEFLTDSFSRNILWTTLRISFLATLISLVLAFPIALYMRQVSPRARSLIAFLLLSPLLTSVVVRTLAWVFILGPKGVLNTALGSIGLPTLPLLYNEIGVVIGMVHVFFGYMALSLMTSLMKLDDNMLLAARNLGAGMWSILWRIVLPLSLPGVLAGSVLVFTMSASTYATPALLGGTGARMMSPEVYDLAIGRLAFDEAAAVATILFFTSAVVVVAGSALISAGRRRVIFE
jgi:putative spermidine/putrescine transport system permease protein